MVCVHAQSESDNAFQRRRKEGRGEEKGKGCELRTPTQNGTL